MKRMAAIFFLATVCCILGGSAVSQVTHPHYQTIQFGPGYSQIGNCNVNGVVYPVGQDFRVWG